MSKKELEKSVLEGLGTRAEGAQQRQQIWAAKPPPPPVPEPRTEPVSAVVSVTEAVTPTLTRRKTRKPQYQVVHVNLEPSMRQRVDQFANQLQHNGVKKAEWISPSIVYRALVSLLPEFKGDLSQVTCEADLKRAFHAFFLKREADKDISRPPGV